MGSGAGAAEEAAEKLVTRGERVGLAKLRLFRPFPAAALLAALPASVRALFFGLGSDGTVGSAKSSVQIIGEETPLFAQGYAVYDSKKSGAITVSHVRFGPKPIRSTYQIQQAGFVACHQPSLLDRSDVLGRAATSVRSRSNGSASPRS